MMKRTTPSAGRSELRRGVTFLEMLIAITILVIVVVAILQLFDKDVEVRKQQDQMAELQQNLRAAMDLISRDVRSANPCGTLMGQYNKPLSNPPISSQVRVPIPIAVAWMPNPGGATPTAYPSSAGLTIAGDSRPDGVAVMRCIGNGIVDIDVAQSVMGPGGTLKFKEPMGIQPTDLPQANGVSKFLMVWSDNPKGADPAPMPCYYTAEIQNVQGGFQNNINPETVVLGQPIAPTDDTYSTFGQQYPNGLISNYSNNSCSSQSSWKAAMVEFVEYMVDKWDANNIPHASFSAATREGSPEHPLLCRRVNPHVTANGTVPDYDVIGQDIENMQIVWILDTDNDPSTTAQMPGFGVEYQAGDPTVSGGFPNAATLGIPLAGLMKNLQPNNIVWRSTFGNGQQTPVILRKARVTLLGRTREVDFAQMKTNVTNPGSTVGYPAIEMTPAFYQGSLAVPRSQAAPWYLGCYRRRSLTSEITIRNYVPASLD